MQSSNDKKADTGVMLRRPRINFDLYFYERTNGHYHLRITPFAIILILIAMVIGFTILWLDGHQHTSPDVKITVPSPTPYSPNSSIIKQAQPPTPKTIRQPKANASMPQLPTPISNVNEQ